MKRKKSSLLFASTRYELVGRTFTVGGYPNICEGGRKKKKNRDFRNNEKCIYRTVAFGETRADITSSRISSTWCIHLDIYVRVTEKFIALRNPLCNKNTSAHLRFVTGCTAVKTYNSRSASPHSTRAPERLLMESCRIEWRIIIIMVANYCVYKRETFWTMTYSIMYTFLR